VRRMLYWHNPFPIYDATYIFRVYPRKKIVPTNSPTGYYTTFFWGNDGTFIWDNAMPNLSTPHPYPFHHEWSWAVGNFSVQQRLCNGDGSPMGPLVHPGLRAWRESPSITHRSSTMTARHQQGYYENITDPSWASRTHRRLQS